MIDINEVLRRAAEMAQRTPRNPTWDRHVQETMKFGGPPLDLRRRPDGVWEMPE